MPINRRDVFLENGRVTIECPRLMSDEELAEACGIRRDRSRQTAQAIAAGIAATRNVASVSQA